MHRHLRAVAWAVVAVMVVASPVAAGSATAKVSSTTVDCGRGAALQSAITAATPGDTIRIKGRCVGTFTVLKDLTLRGVGQQATLDADGADYALVNSFDNGPVFPRTSLTVIGLTITRAEQAGIYNWGELNVQDARLRANRGSGIISEFARFTLERSRVTGNGGYGLSLLNGGATVRFSTITGNASGGIIAADIELADSLVGFNGGDGITCTNEGSLVMEASASVGNAGSGVRASHCPAIISHSLITLNSTSGDGGGIAMPELGLQQGEILRLTDSVVSRNRAAGNGGGIYYSNPETSAEWVTIIGSTFEDNSAAGSGGGVYNDAKMTITSSTVRRNVADGSGGGIFNIGSLTLDRVTIRNNRPSDCSGC